MHSFRLMFLPLVALCACFPEGGPIEGTAPGLSTANSKKTNKQDAFGHRKNKPLGAPWSDMGLPSANAHVMDATEQHLMLGFPEEAPTTDQWKEALKASGWVLVDSGKQPSGSEAFVFTKGENKLGLAIGIEDGATVVYLEDVNAPSQPGLKSQPKPKPGEEENTEPPAAEPPAAGPPAAEPAAAGPAAAEPPAAEPPAAEPPAAEPSAPKDQTP